MGRHVEISPAEKARRIRRVRTLLAQGFSPTTLVKRRDGYTKSEVEEAEALNAAAEAQRKQA